MRQRCDKSAPPQLHPVASNKIPSGRDMDSGGEEKKKGLILNWIFFYCNFINAVPSSPGKMIRRGITHQKPVLKIFFLKY